MISDLMRRGRHAVAACHQAQAAVEFEVSGSRSPIETMRGGSTGWGGVKRADVDTQGCDGSGDPVLLARRRMDDTLFVGAAEYAGLTPERLILKEAPTRGRAELKPATNGSAADRS